MPSERVLVVDDNPANLKLARVLLSAEGYQVSTAADAAEALESVRSSPPSLILMDVQLPGMDGLELTRLLKSDPGTRHIAILALTAYAMKGDEERTLAAGCDAYVSKPIDTRALAGIVARLIRERPAPRDPGRSQEPLGGFDEAKPPAGGG
jgi:CheY-like chemotaxis protein